MEIYLTIDVGTYRTQGGSDRRFGKIVASDYTEYPLSSPQPGYSEQEPEDWWQGFVKGCHNLKAHCPQEFASVLGIGICGQMHNTGLS
jgi:xylulokinase